MDHKHGDDCAAYLSKNGLNGGIIVPTYLARQTAAFEFNQLVIDAVEKHPTLYGGLWVSPLEAMENQLVSALKLLPHPGIKALKWHRIHGKDAASTLPAGRSGCGRM